MYEEVYYIDIITDYIGKNLLSGNTRIKPDRIGTGR
jgi:hypothetical protein